MPHLARKVQKTASKGGSSPSAAADQELCFAPGDQVEIVNLTSAQGRPLNGSKGIVTSFCEEVNRYEVKLVDHSNLSIHVTPNCVQRRLAIKAASLITHVHTYVEIKARANTQTHRNMGHHALDPIFTRCGQTHGLQAWALCRCMRPPDTQGHGICTAT